MKTYKGQKKTGLAAIVLLISLGSFGLFSGALALADLDAPDGEDGLGAVEVKVLQSSRAPTAKPEKSATTRSYVQPQWIDGGYGVEILEPGHWTSNEDKTKRP